MGAGAKREVVLGLVQARVVDDLDANLEAAVAAVRRAADRGAQVVVLQELFRSPYPAQSEDPDRFDWAEPVPGPSTEAMAKVARERGVAVVVPVFERRGPGLYHNSVAVVNPDGEIAGLYRKSHIPDDPAFYEKFYFAPGDTGVRVVETPFCRLAPLICWDQWFPEQARLAALAGAEVLVYPTAIGWLPGEREGGGETARDAWRTVQRAHAIANGLYVAAANRVGEEPGPTGGIRFWGTSFVAGPDGAVLAEAPVEEDAILVVRCDLARIEAVRRTWPFLRDRRIDAYADLLKRWNA